MGRALFSFALPIAGVQLLQAAAGLAALLLLGRLGADALSAAATPVALCALACALFAPFATGLMAAIAQARASRDEARIKNLITRGVRSALLFGIADGATGVLGAPLFLRLANVPPPVASTAVAFAQLLAVALPAIFVFTTYSAALEALGAAGAAAGMLAASTLLFAGALFALHAGALSVPLALLASTVPVALAAAAILYARSPRFRLDASAGPPIFTAREIGALVRFDAPSAAQLLAVAFADVALVAIANEFGVRAGAAFLVVAATLAMLSIPGAAIGAAVSVTPGSGRHALPAYGLIAAATCVAVYVFASPVLAAIVPDPQAFAAARTGVYAVAWSALALGVGTIVSSQVVASDEGFWPAAIAISGVWLMLVPFARLFTLRWGLDGLWYSYAMTFIAVTLVQASAAPILLRRARAHAAGGRRTTTP